MSYIIVLILKKCILDFLDVIKYLLSYNKSSPVLRGTMYTNSSGIAKAAHKQSINFQFKSLISITIGGSNDAEDLLRYVCTAEAPKNVKL